MGPDSLFFEHKVRTRNREMPMTGTKCLNLLFFITIWTVFPGCSFHASPLILGPDTHVLVRAAPDTATPASIGIFLLKGPREYAALCKGLTLFAHRKLTAEGFPEEVVLMDSAASTEAQAADQAAARRLQWAFWGAIEEYRYGGVTGTSKVTLSLKLIDAATGEPVWYLVGTMAGKGRGGEDYVLFKLENPGAPQPDDIAFTVLNDLVETVLRNGSMGPVRPSGI